MIDAIAELGCAVTAREIADRLRDRSSRIGLASIYRTLELLDRHEKRRVHGDHEAPLVRTGPLALRPGGVHGHAGQEAAQRLAHRTQADAAEDGPGRQVDDLPDML
ncbi:MAG: transcriptional repressor [Gemmatimonadaceae bacterium]